MTAWMQTASGRHFDLVTPKPAQVDWSDIALHLSRINRFLGATSVPYSVAQHSVHCHDHAPDGVKLAALLHDAHEAYIGDLTRPVKQALGLVAPAAIGAWWEIETAIQATIHEAAGLDAARIAALEDDVKHVDNRMLATERRDLMLPCERDWSLAVEPYPVTVRAWPWPRAFEAFLDRLALHLPNIMEVAR